LLGGMMIFAKKVAGAIDKAIECKRVGVAVIGLEVPHAHIHLIPINHISDIDFSRPKLKFTEDEYRMVMEDIKKSL
jgi:histidine triad (HIT) family protein